MQLLSVQIIMNLEMPVMPPSTPERIPISPPVIGPVSNHISYDTHL
jgi:hypothetical protein